MNIVYDLVPETGLMRLKFKDSVINNFKDDTKLIFDKYVLPMLAMNDKFVLTGSLSLKLLGFEPIDRVGDIDIGLLSPFTEEEWTTLKNFFGLQSTQSEMYNTDPTQAPKFDPNAHMWQFYKQWSEPVDDELMRTIDFKMDIFNDEMLRKKDIIEVYLGDFPVRLVHPSITYSYRMRYALDVRTSKTFKYWEQMMDRMKNAKSYYNMIRAIYKMISRVHEHNTNIEDNKEKLIRLRALIDRREEYADSFMDKVFKETIDPFTFIIEQEQEQWAVKANKNNDIKTVSKITL
jgi:hypothetical protein